jgi:DNA-binding transcriptional regulator YiaG
MTNPAIDGFRSQEFVEIGAVARQLGVTADTLRTWE